MMSTEKTAILLMNIGSPDQPRLFAVWKYLTRFLNDKYVIDLPWLLRKFLVNLIIIPLRVKKSTLLYKKIWTERGSPLIYHSLETGKNLQKMLDDNFKVFVAMRYGEPDYKTELRKIRQEKFNRLILIPLFPQYAMSTNGSAVNAVKKEIVKQKMEIELTIADQFYNHPKFIDAFVKQAEKYGLDKFDHIIFSYHGLPLRQLEKCHPGIKVKNCDCEFKVPEYGHHCYRATCYATTRLLADKLGLKSGKYTTAFQSRLSRNWMEPFTDKILLSKLHEGKKRILIIAPSFVTDCLETLTEIGEDYRKTFLEKGGEELQLVESLNFSPLWIEALKTIINEHSNKKNTNGK
jgi:protoporphyrin/coproporphyrin ferrochelatase